MFRTSDSVAVCSEQAGLGNVFEKLRFLFHVLCEASVEELIDHCYNELCSNFVYAKKQLFSCSLHRIKSHPVVVAT